MAYVDAELFYNAVGTLGKGTISGSHNNSTTTLTLTTGHGARFPAVASGQRMRLAIEDEIVIVTAHTANADTMTMTRGAEGTTAATHASGVAVQAVLSADAQRRYAPGLLLQPRHAEMLAWAYPAIMASGVMTISTGNVRYHRCYVPETITVTNFHLRVSTLQASATNVYGGIYAGIGHPTITAGTLIAKTANQASGVGSTGFKTWALTAEAGQSLTLAGGEDVWYYLGTLQGGGTAASFNRQATDPSLYNCNLVAADGFYAGALGSGLTALAATITISSMAANDAPWMGLS